MLEISTLPAFEVWVNRGPSDHPAAIQALSLKEHSELIKTNAFPDSIFLACTMDDVMAGHIVQTGGVVIPDLEGVSFQVHRSRLYSVGELFEGFELSNPKGYLATHDYSIYQEYFRQGKEYAQSINISLARRLHDHSITEALHEELENERVVAIMGGHGMERQDPFYRKVAITSRELTRDGFLMVSGGGPGAMEATHLGAYFATRELDELDAAITMLKKRPEGAPPAKEYEDADWLHRAWRVMDAFPIPPGKEDDCKSIGIPTWLYGHEPPAPFATHIAKYFANSVREDGLLAIARHGVIFAPGSAGTTQEVFQDAAQNHYGTQEIISPMIMFGEHHWTEVRPVWPLLQAVSRGHQYGELIALTDSEEEIIRRIKMFDPSLYIKKTKPPEFA